MAPVDKQRVQFDRSPDKNSESTSSRRGFLTAAAAFGAISAVGPTTARSRPASITAGHYKAARSSAASVCHWNLQATRIEYLFGDGTVVPFFRFESVGSTPSAGALPLLKALAGRPVTITLANTLPFAVQPTIVQYETGPRVEPGQTADWNFQMPPGGTWLLTDALLGPAAGPVGFGATVISIAQPSLTQLAVAEDKYQQEYVLLYQDADDRWNFAVDAGDEPDTSLYEPNYHTLNGLTFPETMVDPDTLIKCDLGDLVLIRMGNLGHVRHAIHFHGYHASFVYRNRIRESVLPPKDTFEITGHSTVEIELPVIQSGVFPLHPHSLTMTTDNGTYPFGQITLIDAEA